MLWVSPGTPDLITQQITNSGIKWAFLNPDQKLDDYGEWLVVPVDFQSTEATAPEYAIYYPEYGEREEEINFVFVDNEGGEASISYLLNGKEGEFLALDTKHNLEEFFQELKKEYHLEEGVESESSFEELWKLMQIQKVMKL